MIEILDNFLFLFKTLFILSFEGFKYLFFGDYFNLIKNICIKLSKENMFYVKFFQAISTNNNFLNKELIEFLLNYTDNVPFDKKQLDYGFYHNVGIVKRIYPNLNIDENSLKVINSGLIAVVFKGKMHDKDVIIKVIKKNIKEEMRISIRRIEFLISIFHRLPFLKPLNIVEIFSENKQIMLDQVNFINEVKNIKLFQERFKNVNNIIIPNAYEQFTYYDNNMIVMDYIDGKKINELHDDDKDEYCLQLAKFGAKCILYDGIYHGDMHPGNILFLQDNHEKKLGILDFGIVGKITREEQNSFYLFFSKLLANDFRNASVIILDMLSEPSFDKNMVLTNSDRENLINKMEKICEHALLIKRNFDASDISEINKLLYKYNLKLSRFFCRIEFSLAISDSVCQTLSKNKTYIQNFNKAIEELYPENLF